MTTIYVHAYSPVTINGEKYRLVVVKSKEEYNDICHGNKYSEVITTFFKENVIYGYKNLDKILKDITHTRINIDTLKTDLLLIDIPISA